MQGRPWLRQANSDMTAARRVRDDSDPSSYCQVIAKCQQVVEKSVKAIAEELSARGAITITIGFKHDIAPLISAIRRKPKSRDKSVPDYVVKTLERNLDEINEIMDLAPRRRPDTTLLSRNTEYPYHNAQSNLIAPADVNSFNLVEVERYLVLASRIYNQANTLITASERTPR
jgi:HEPN domain-containing protein